METADRELIQIIDNVSSELAEFDQIELAERETKINETNVNETNINLATTTSDEPVPEEPAPIELPQRDWKQKVIAAAGYTKGEEKIFWFGMAMDLTFFTIWLILIFTVLDSKERNDLWWMPILGIFGSIIAVATPAGSGIIYFPALTLLKVPANQAVAFNYATAALNLGFFGTVAWLRKRPDILQEYWWIGLWLTFWGWIGCGMGIFLFPIESEVTLRILFLIFSFLVLIYVLWMIWRSFTGTLVTTGEVTKVVNNLLGLFVVGLSGGIVVAWISIGLDTISFVVLSYIFTLHPLKATIGGVLVMGYVSILPLLHHIITLEDVPYSLWLMVTGGAIIGARLGPFLNALIGTVPILAFFALMLTIEVCRTFVELVIIPNVNIVGDV